MGRQKKGRVGKQRAEAAGAGQDWIPPGMAGYEGDRDPAQTSFSIIRYNLEGAWMKTAETVEELLSHRDAAFSETARSLSAGSLSAGSLSAGPSPHLDWINVNGFKDADAISRLARAYDIHPLTVEDILDTEQRPKTEEFDAYILVILKDINRQDRDELDFDQISLVLLKDTVITFQELPVRSFEFIRRRLFSNAGRIRRMGAGYLAYMVLDTTVDDYAQTLDRLGDQIEDFENRAAQETGDDFIDESQRLKRELLQLRRAVWPLRENLSLMRYESPLLSADLSPFFTDLHDHVVQAAETIDAYREVIAGVMEVNLSALSNRTNRVMKVLTIISTLFIPLTFIVGVYGMNFRTMPELEYRYAYPITWVVMILIAGIMLLVFKRRKWF